jgi:hypothetical protein
MPERLIVVFFTARFLPYGEQLLFAAFLHLTPLCIPQLASSALRTE